MLKWLKSLFQKQDGNVLVITSFAFTGLIALAGLVIDGGHLYMTKTELQKVANAAALSGAQVLVREEDSGNRVAKVTTVVQDILQKHDEVSSLAGSPKISNTQLTVKLEKKCRFIFFQFIWYRFRKSKR
ncbi:MAG: Tad domain-containing protein [Bacillus sp. (in: Bacteria)]|nr:Tad domain-containing protein [Bacillus sp. (in: firmicutes)]